jgi:ATP synthase protein I
MTNASSGSKPHPVSDGDDALEEQEFHPWSAEQAQVWRQSQPAQSVWRVLQAQMLVALLGASAVGWWFHSLAIGLSWLYGALSVVLPAALFARGLTSPVASLNALSAALGFMVWQAVKWVVAVLLLVLAPRCVADLSWPALLAGLIVTMKVYWLALIWGRSRGQSKPTTAL